MSSRGEEVRVKIVRKKGHGGGHHGGAWKVAYADFVTTLMALFIVLWIVGQNEAVKTAVANYFKNPTILPGSRTATLTPGGAGILPAERVPTGEERDSDEGTSEQKALQAAAGKIKELTEKGGGFEDLRDQIRTELTAEGLRIELIERDGVPFFEVGSAVFRAPGRMDGFLKYCATATFTVSFWPTIHSTMKSAIIVVTKSA